LTESFITTAKKKAWLPRLIEDQGGFICYQCSEILKPGHYCFEHLNDKRNDTRYENTGLACTPCNIKKINDYDMKLEALALLKKKEEAGLKYLEDETAHQQYSSEMASNKVLYSFHDQYLTEHTNTDGKILFSDAIDELPYLCQKRFGCGSEASTRRYIKQLSCKASLLQVIKDESNKKWIVKRVLN